MLNQDKAKQRVWEQKITSQSEAGLTVFVSRAVQRVMLVGCDW